MKGLRAPLGQNVDFDSTVEALTLLEHNLHWQVALGRTVQFPGSLLLLIKWLEA